jgi:hypothetical protein
MKKLLFIVALIMGLTTNAQNMIGQSRFFVTAKLEEEGHVVHYYPETDEKFGYILVSEPDMGKMYMFNSQNICFEYHLAIYGLTLSGWRDVFDANVNFVERNGDYYDIDGQFRVTITWDGTLVEWVAKFEAI